MGHTASSHSHGQWALPGLIEVRSQQDTGVLLQNQWLFGGRFATLLAGLGVSEGVRICIRPRNFVGGMAKQTTVGGQLVV
jgi:hypothetical protein